MISNEADFSRQVVSFWRKQNYFVQRVETGSVNRGVPDIYVETKTAHHWVELKKVHTHAYDGMIIPWRPGQQGWMIEYYKLTGNVCITLVHCLDYILIIPMTKIFKGNKIDLCSIKTVSRVSELLI